MAEIPESLLRRSAAAGALVGHASYSALALPATVGRPVVFDGDLNPDHRSPRHCSPHISPWRQYAPRRAKAPGRESGGSAPHPSLAERNVSP